MKTPSKPAISIARPAKLRPDGYVALELIVDGMLITGIVHRSRGSGAPDAPSCDLEAAALHFTANYVESNPLLFHRLFTNDVPVRGKVSAAPWIEQRYSEKWLGFKLIADEVTCEMFISAELQSRSFRPTIPAPADEESLLMLWASAYDVCLAYMIQNLEEIRLLGFDTSELLRQCADCKE